MDPLTLSPCCFEILVAAGGDSGRCPACNKGWNTATGQEIKPYAVPLMTGDYETKDYVPSKFKKKVATTHLTDAGIPMPETSLGAKIPTPKDRKISEGKIVKVAGKTDNTGRTSYRATVLQQDGYRTNGVIPSHLVRSTVDALESNASGPHITEENLVIRAFKNRQVKVTGKFVPTPDDPTFFWWDSSSHMEIIP